MSFILVIVGIRSKARNEMLTILAKNESPIITPDMKNPLRLYVEKKNADSNLYYKSLISMREDAKLEFSDTKLRDEYKEYVNNYK